MPIPEPFLPLRRAMDFMGNKNLHKGWGYSCYPDGVCETWLLDDDTDPDHDRKYTYQNGVVKWFSKGDNDSHKVVYPDGVEEWYKKGELHRIGGPAVTYPDGAEEWHVDGELHRIGGPAVTYPDGTEEWFKGDELHRVGGPAIQYPDGGYLWYHKGHLHRENGPAIKHSAMSVSGRTGSFLLEQKEPVLNQWWLKGVIYTEEEYIEKMKRIRFLRFKYFHKWYDRLDDLSTSLGKRRMLEHFERLNDIN